MLRRWRWRKFRGRIQPVDTHRSSRPGDMAVAGAPLYLAGVAGGNEDKAAQGLRLLLSAAEQGIGASGITLEGSSLRQVQLARLFTSAWIAARGAGRAEQWRLAAVARSVLAALDAISLTGGLPEIGETPDGLKVREPFAGWGAEDRALAEELRRQTRLTDLETLRQDGWLRLDSGPWSALWACPPSGWPAHDGLAHHDLGGCELHWQGEPLFVDPGSPPPSLEELGPLYRSNAVHGGVSLDGEDPYPENRAIYTDAFRREEAGPPPVLRATHDGAKLEMEGFARFGGHRVIERHWRFGKEGMAIDDLVLGTGHPLIERRFVTPWAVVQEENGVLLSKGAHRLFLSADRKPVLHPARRWSLAGHEIPLTLILFGETTALPWRGRIELAVRP